MALAVLYSRALAGMTAPPIVDRERYVHYHYDQARSILENHVESELAAGKSMLHVLLGGGHAEHDELDSCLIRVSANATACIQSMHSLADILTHAAYYSLALNRSGPSVDERQISLQGEFAPR